MDSSTLALLGCMAGFGLLIILGFGLVFLLVVRQTSRPYSAQQMAQAETNATNFLAQAMPQLLSWRPEALADLAARWEGTRSGFLPRQYQGTVKSLASPDQPGWLAYYLSLKGSQGLLLLRTTESEIRLDMAGTEIRVTGNGQPLGRMPRDGGAIFDPSGQPIGQYHRYQGWRWSMGSAPVTKKYGPLELHGRTVAEISDALVRGSSPFVADSTRRPLIQNLVSDLQPEEIQWLLALVGLELLHDALRQRRQGRSPGF